MSKTSTRVAQGRQHTGVTIELQITVFPEQPTGDRDHGVDKDSAGHENAIQDCCAADFVAPFEKSGYDALKTISTRHNQNI
jgi:hypothetical protein